MKFKTQNGKRLVDLFGDKHWLSVSDLDCFYCYLLTQLRQSSHKNPTLNIKRRKYLMAIRRAFKIELNRALPLNVSTSRHQHRTAKIGKYYIVG